MLRCSLPSVGTSGTSIWGARRCPAGSTKYCWGKNARTTRATSIGKRPALRLSEYVNKSMERWRWLWPMISLSLSLSSYRSPVPSSSDSTIKGPISGPCLYRLFFITVGFDNAIETVINFKLYLYIYCGFFSHTHIPLVYYPTLYITPILVYIYISGFYLTYICEYNLKLITFSISLSTPTKNKKIKTVNYFHFFECLIA